MDKYRLSTSRDHTNFYYAFQGSAGRQGTEIIASCMKTLYIEEFGGDQVSANVTITILRLYNITQALRLHVCDVDSNACMQNGLNYNTAHKNHEHP